jgi:hypothetical protein
VTKRKVESNEGGGELKEGRERRWARADKAVQTLKEREQNRNTHRKGEDGV